MNTPAPATEASAASIAQAYQEARDGKFVHTNIVGLFALIDKRAREIDAAPAAAVGGGELTDEVLYAIADQQVKDWQKDGRMEPYAWDFRGFAIDAMRRFASSDNHDEAECTHCTPPAGGFVVVPREPTTAMINAGFANDIGSNFLAGYAAMIAASPTAQPSAKDGVRGDESDSSELLVCLSNAVAAYAETEDKYVTAKDRSILRRQVSVIRTHMAALPEATAASGLVDAKTERLREGWERECDDTDKIIAKLGIPLDRARTEGGSLNVPRILNHIQETLDALGNATAFGAHLSDRIAANPQPIAGVVSDEVVERVLAEWQRAMGGTMINKYWHVDQVNAMRAALQSVWPGQKGVDEEADMFWDDADPERAYDSITEIVGRAYEHGYGDGVEIEIQRAIRLPNIKVRMRIEDPENPEYTYELIEDTQPPAGTEGAAPAIDNGTPTVAGGDL